ncbi:hypothetical protein [Liquorilactobacillus hordei]|uniref:hypothetical protein n=1 Tax=Liquorilactobacillus hordei TaxID=468911 RepID=UPI0039ECB138
MVKTGVDIASWKAAVNKSKGGAVKLSKYKSLELSKTNLVPFTSFKDLIEAYNSSVANFKSFSEQDAVRMIAAGQNKKKDDTNGQKQFSSARGKG